MGIPDHLTCLLRNLEPDVEQQTSSKLGKEYIKAVFCHPAFLTFMQSTTCEALGWIKHELESRNINHLRYADDTTLRAESEEELKNVLMKVKEESENVGLRLSIQKTNLMASGPISSVQFSRSVVSDSLRPHE